MEAAQADIAPDNNGKKFSFSAFFLGLVVVCLFYGLMGGGLWFYGPKTLEKQQSRLASQTVLVERPGAVETSAIGQTPQHGDEKQEHDEDGETASSDTGIGVAATPVPHDALPAELTRLESGLAAAPVEGLYEDTEFGRLPVRHKDGMTPFQAYRRPFDRASMTGPIVSIAIMDLGLSDSATESAIRSMPPDISFVLSPYAKAPDFWINESRVRGHEIWMTLPMETKNYPEIDPGPHTMLVSAPERENQMKLSWLLARASGYIGFVASRDPAFMTSTNDMRPVIGGIYNRGLGFIDTSSEPGLVPQTMALGQKAPYANVDLWLDDTATKDSISAALDELERKAREQGSAIGIIHPLPVSYQEVLRWADTLKDKGIILVPLSAQTGF